MKYILKNFKSFYIHKRKVFLLLICTAVLSCITLEFSYGVFENYRIKQLSQSKSRTEMVIDILDREDDSYFSKEMLEQCINGFSEEVKRKLNGVILVADGKNEEQAYCYFSVRNNRWIPYQEVKENLLQNNLATEYFSEEQEEQGKYVALFPVDLDGNLLQDVFHIEQNTIYFQGNSYQVIGYQKFDNVPIVPFGSLQEDTRIDTSIDINISFREALNPQDYNNLKESFLSVAEGYVEFPQIDFSEENSALYNTIKLVSVLIALVSAINFTILFQYLLQEYQKSFRVFRICGMSKGKMSWNFMMMCIIISAGAFLAGTAGYHYGIYRTFLVKIFPYMWSVYSLKKYLLLFGIYFLFILVVSGGMIKKFISKQRLTVK